MKTQAQSQELVLMQRVQAGDTLALGELYDRHAHAMTALAFQLLGNLAEAEDLVQDVFMESWHRAADYDHKRSSVKTWFYLRLRSRAMDKLRSEARWKKLEEAIGKFLPWVTQEEEITAFDAEWLREQMNNLRPDQFDVVHAVYFDGLTSSETSQKLCIPLGTVKSRLASALKHLRNFTGSR
ncbi:MAG: sigma-70 family RNA polymerase sigma factor [Bradymonadales bacterium]|jgi:RNA polymerase sigma-70 factor (ECF subfamily)